MLEVKMICGTLFLNLDNPIYKYPNGLLLSNIKEFIEENFMDEDFFKMFGDHDINALANNFFFNTTRHIEKLNLIFNTSIPFIHEVNTILTFLWFSKDNSVNFSNIYIACKSAEKYGRHRVEAMYSDSKGEFQTTNFNMADLAFARKVQEKWAEISAYRLVEKNTEYIKRPVNDHVEILMGEGGNSLKHDIHNRIDRATVFLDVARRQENIPLKVSLYMTVFECLFTTDASEVNHKIGERVCMYMSDNKKGRLEIYKKIKDAYGLRSKYIHGQSLKKKNFTRDKMLVVSQEIDELLRGVLIKVILEDSHIFLKNDTELGEWFNELIFS